MPNRCSTPPLPTVRLTLAHNSPRVYNARLKQWARRPSDGTFVFAVASGIASHVFGLIVEPEHMGVGRSGSMSWNGAQQARNATVLI